jgi:cell division protease FtsH
MAATNRSDIIDPALIRPGRFDRQITINLPTVKDREAILKVHARGKRFDKSVTAPEIAQLTTGFSGADLANLLNEAAILAVRRKKKSISIFEILTTIDRILLGLEGRSSLRVRTRQNIAFQEVSYAVMSSVLNSSTGIQKLTIIPRASTQSNMNLNASAIQYPSRQTFINQIVLGLSRRAVEEIIQGASESTVACQQDIAQLTRALRGMIVRFAMAKLQELKQESQQRNLFLLGSDIKAEITNVIDVFSTDFVDLTYYRVLNFLTFSRPLIERIADQLIAFEEIDGTTFRTFMKEFFFNFEDKNKNIVLDSRNSALFEILFPDIFKSPLDIEKKTKRLLLETKQLINEKNKKAS